MITASYLILVAAAAGFGFRMLRGPTLADRVSGVNGVLLVGMSAIGVQAVDTGNGAFLPVLVLLSLVGFVSTAILARYIESRGR
jgi:multisubunit Na+/H+ antiporter MnhF subunit